MEVEVNSAGAKYYKYCLVPMCKSTTFSTPNKVFIRVPKVRTIREKWLTACRRKVSDLSTSSTLIHVCEDHFNLEEDMSNYIRFKLMGGIKKMKSNVVPHIFDCQSDRKRAFSRKPRAVAQKRAKLNLIEEAIASTSAIVPPIKDTSPISNNNETPVLSLPSETSDVNTTNTIEVSTRDKKDVAVTARPTVRSKGIQCRMQCGVTVGLSPIRLLTNNVSTSPTKPKMLHTVPEEQKSEISSSEDETSDDDYISRSSNSSTTSFEEDAMEMIDSLKILSLNCTVKKTMCMPRMYIGLREENYYVVTLLEKYCKLSNIDILLTLTKIRLGHSFAELGIDFGMSTSQSSRIFSKSLPILSKYLRKLIVFSPKSNLKPLLPLGFRARYSNVGCIIDCLEIEIEKPSDPVKQALTWSDYKKCNTLKYLISSTPDGIINFISTGFGGRTSDTIIVETCCFLDILVPGMAVMADRGFKHIEHLLIAKDCVLVRPPSVSSGCKSSKSEVLETKRIASLRIHIERVIRRLREFAFLQPHACINTKLIPYTNMIIKIVCGLVNLQGALIKGK